MCSRPLRVLPLLVVTGCWSPSAARPIDNVHAASGSAMCGGIEIVAPTVSSCSASECETACEAGDADACGQAGGLLLKNDTSRANVLLDRACTGGGASWCFVLAGMLQDGLRATPQDVPRANALYRRGCCLGDATSCDFFGTRVYFGTGIALDREAGVHWWERGCTFGSGEACLKLAAAAFTGQGIGRDEERAERILIAECDRGHREACIDLARVYAATAVLPQRARGIRMLREHCDALEATVCYGLATLYANGRAGTSADPQQARALYKMACTLGESRACAP